MKAAMRFKLTQLTGLLVLAAVIVQAIPPTQVANAAPLSQSAPALQQQQAGVIEFPSQGYGSKEYGQKYEINLLRMLNQMSTTGTLPVSKDGVFDCVSLLGNLDAVDTTFIGNGQDSLDPAEGYFKLANYAGTLTPGAGACDVCSMLYDALTQLGFIEAPGHSHTPHPPLAGIRPGYSVSIWSTDPSQNMWLQNKNATDVTVRWTIDRNAHRIKFWVEGGTITVPPEQAAPEPPKDIPVGSPIDVYTISPLGVRQGCELEGGCDDPYVTGIDLIGIDGSPVKSTITGKVIAAGIDAFGNTYATIESDGWVERHRHGNYSVQAGQEIKAGDQIGTMGKVGIEEQPLPMEFYSLFDKAAGQNFQTVDQYQEAFARRPKWWFITIPGTEQTEVPISPELKKSVVDWWNKLAESAGYIVQTPLIPQGSTTEVMTVGETTIAIAHLDLGARIVSTGGLVDGKIPPKALSDHFAELGEKAVCVTNGSFFEPGADKPLSFFWKKNNSVQTDGAISLDNFLPRILYINGAEVSVGTTLNKDYQGDVIVGLVPETEREATGITLVGVNGQTVYLLSGNGTVKSAVDSLISLGVPEANIVMFDGGGSTGMQCTDGVKITGTSIPQGIGIVSGEAFAPNLTVPLDTDWQPQDDTAWVRQTYPSMVNDVVETTYPGGIVVHHTAEALGTTASQWADNSLGIHVGENRVTYNIVIGRDGVAHQTAVFGSRSYHANCWDSYCPNREYFSIAMSGNFMEEKPTQAQLDTLVKVIRWLVRNGVNPQVYGHRDILAMAAEKNITDATTDCPGDNLYQLLPELSKQATTPEFPVGGPRLRINLEASNRLIVIVIVLTVLFIVVRFLINALFEQIRWRQYYRRPKDRKEKEPSWLNRTAWFSWRFWWAFWMFVIIAHRAWLARYAIWATLPDPTQGFEVRLWVPNYYLYLTPIVLLVVMLIRIATRVPWKAKRVLLPEAQQKPPTKKQLRARKGWRIFRIISVILLIVSSFYVLGAVFAFDTGPKPGPGQPTPLPLDPTPGMQELPSFFAEEVRRLGPQVNALALEQDLPPESYFVLWLKESGGRKLNPNNGEGLCGFYSKVNSGTYYFPPGAISDAEVLRQLRLCGEELKAHAARVGVTLHYNTSDFEQLGPVYMVYNGNIDCHGGEFASWRDHPYVMNGYDADHKGMIARDGNGGCVALKIIGAIPAHIRVNQILVQSLAPTATPVPTETTVPTDTPVPSVTTTPVP